MLNNDHSKEFIRMEELVNQKGKENCPYPALILIVDDDLTTQFLLQEMLKSKVLYAVTGESQLKCF